MTPVQAIGILALEVPDEKLRARAQEIVDALSEDDAQAYAREFDRAPLVSLPRLA